MSDYSKTPKSIPRRRQKPVERMNLEEVKEAIRALRKRCDSGEITREQFQELGRPLRARFEQLF